MPIPSAAIKIQIALLFAFVAGLLTACFQHKTCDLVVHNATIYSVDDAMNIHQAMAISDGKILELGPEREIMNKYKAKAYYDAAKKPVYPGFMDAHCHFLYYGIFLDELDLNGTQSLDECLGKIRDYALAHPDGWIQGRGWDQNKWRPRVYPTRQMLDSVAPGRLVVLSRVDGHASWVSTTVLKAAGVPEKIEDVPEGMLTINGSPTGILIDNAEQLITTIVPNPSRAKLIDGLKESEKRCFAVGLTSVADAGLPLEYVMLIDSLHQSGILQMPVYAMLNPDEATEAFMMKGHMETSRLLVRSVKLYADGALGSRGALLKVPYHDHTNHYGAAIEQESFYRKWITLCADYNYQCNTHCIGDSANRWLLELYGDALKGVNDQRWRIEHAQVVDRKDMDLFSKYTIIPSVQPTHATSDMRWAGERLGPEREHRGYAYATLLRQNGMLALGTDFPVEAIDPLKTFYAAITRQDVEGYPDSAYFASEKLSREEALRGMTIWAALAQFQENEKGSLEPGKWANFIVLSQDIMKVELKQVLSSRIERTAIHGKWVYTR